MASDTLCQHPSVCLLYSLFPFCFNETRAPFIRPLLCTKCFAWLPFRQFLSSAVDAIIGGDGGSERSRVGTEIWFGH